MEILFLFVLFGAFLYLGKGFKMEARFYERSELRRARSYIEKKSKVTNI